MDWETGGGGAGGAGREGLSGAEQQGGGSEPLGVSFLLTSRQDPTSFPTAGKQLLPGLEALALAGLGVGVPEIP